MLAIGTVAPDFVLPDQNGVRVSRDDLLAEGPVVLYFYPADFTPGCTREACDFRDIHDDLVTAGLRIAGVSPQGPDMHRRFADRYRLPFTLLCDEDKSVIRAYDVNGPLGFGVRRATFLIEANARIRDAFLAEFRIGQHQAFVRKAIATQTQG